MDSQKESIETNVKGNEKPNALKLGWYLEIVNFRDSFEWISRSLIISYINDDENIHTYIVTYFTYTYIHILYLHYNTYTYTYFNCNSEIGPNGFLLSNAVVAYKAFSIQSMTGNSTLYNIGLSDFVVSNTPLQSLHKLKSFLFKLYCMPHTVA